MLPRIARKLGSHLIHVSKIDLRTFSRPAQLFGNSKAKDLKDLPDDRIAVIGMATQVPGAEDIGEVWKVLTAGKPQHREVPKERFEMELSGRKLIQIARGTATSSMHMLKIWSISLRNVPFACRVVV